MAATLSIGERRLPVIHDEESDPVFFANSQDSTRIASDDDVTQILQQPIYAESNDYAINSDATESDATASTDDTPLAFLPDDANDSLFSNLDGSLLDELLAV